MEDGVNKIIVLGVNYASAKLAEDFAQRWKACDGVAEVYLVDNHSDDEEAARMTDVGQRVGAKVLHRKNDGYGPALNDSLAQVLRDHAEEALVLFGNVDVLPVNVGSVRLGPSELPEFEVLEGRRNRNPFLTYAQRALVPLHRVPLRLQSYRSLRVVSALTKIAGLLPARTWAVHGSMLGATTSQLRRMLPIFPKEMFLYCEELAFARRAEALGYRFVKVPLTVSHIGEASTYIFRGKQQKFLRVWSASMASYLAMDRSGGAVDGGGTNGARSA